MANIRVWLLGAIGVALIMALCLAAAVHLDRARLQAESTRSPRLLQVAQAQLESNMQAQLRLRAELLALDNATMAYVVDALQQGGVPGQTIDTASISDVLADRRAQLGLDLVGVIGVDGRWVTGTRPWGASNGMPLQHPLFQQARDGHELAMGLVLDERRLFLGAIQPIVRAGSVDAYLYTATEIEAGFIAALTRLAPFDISIFAAASPDQALLRSSPDAPNAAAQTADNRQLDLFGDSKTARLAWTAKAGISGDASSSRNLLMGLGALLSLLWLVLVAAIWVRVLRPVDNACDLLERAAMGDFHLRAPAWPMGRRGRFAAAFDRLMLRMSQH